MPRFYIDAPLQAPSTLVLPPEIVRHVHVLRLTEGDEVVLFNGMGGEYHGQLGAITKKQVSVTLHSHHLREAEMPVRVTLAQGIAGGDKMDWLIEKAVELGVSAVHPLLTERSVVRLQGERAEKRQAHWQAVVQAACEQSGRNQIPQVSEIVNLSQWFTANCPQNSPCVLLSPRAELTLSQWFTQAQSSATPIQMLTLLIGPEGGLSAHEESVAIQAGCVAVSLGHRILRTETAGLAVLAALNTLCGEF